MNKNKQTISDLDGFKDICNETELYVALAGCDSDFSTEPRFPPEPPTPKGPTSPTPYGKGDSGPVPQPLPVSN